VRDLRAVVELVSPGLRAGRPRGARGDPAHRPVRLRGLSRRDADVLRDRGGVTRAQHRGVPDPGGPLRGPDPGAGGRAHPARRGRKGDERGTRSRPRRGARRRGVRPHRRDHGQGGPEDAPRRPEVGRTRLLFRPPLDEPERLYRHHNRPDRRLLPWPAGRHGSLHPRRPGRDGPRRPQGRRRDRGVPGRSARPWGSGDPPISRPARGRGRPRERALPQPDAHGGHRGDGRRHRDPDRSPRDRPDPPDLSPQPPRRRDARLALLLPLGVRPLRLGGGARDLLAVSGRARAARGAPLGPAGRARGAHAPDPHGSRLRRRHPRHPDGPATRRRLPPRRRPLPRPVGRSAPARRPVNPPAHPLLQRRHHALPADGPAPARGRPETELALRPRRRNRRPALPRPPHRAAPV
ncbi:MAG: hypothetical protein AVDCRST_MAG01-01-2281, partial [uncultured Rubrobacteraceae bacterium]